MSEPTTPDPAQPDDPGRSKQWSVWLLALAAAAAVVLSVLRTAAPASSISLTAVLLGIPFLLALWMRRQDRLDREAERYLYGEEQPRQSLAGVFLEIFWMAAWVLVLVFSDGIIAHVASWIAGFLESLGLPEMKSTVEAFLRALLLLLILWGWVASWRARRHERRKARELVYGTRDEAVADEG